MRTDVFGDLTVHGSFVSTNSMVFQDTYAERVHVSQEQDLVIQEETRVPRSRVWTPKMCLLPPRAR